MKKIIILITLGCCFAACGPSRSDQITGLNEQKKALNDSIRYYRGWEQFFNGKAVTVAKTAHDSLEYKPFVDSQYKYSSLRQNSENILKGVNSSLDSLSKMK